MNKEGRHICHVSRVACVILNMTAGDTYTQRGVYLKIHWKLELSMSQMSQNRRGRQVDVE